MPAKTSRHKVKLVRIAISTATHAARQLPTALIRVTIFIIIFIVIVSIV
jgi:CHASE3 domain sensor protein